jgi:hypothetical protein
MNEFEAASVIFWLTFFAVQRGCPQNAIPAILEHLVQSSGNKTEFYHTANDDYELAFKRIHGVIASHFESALRNLVNQWMESEGGKELLIDHNWRR